MIDNFSRKGFLRTAAALAAVPTLLPADPAVAAQELPDFPRGGGAVPLQRVIAEFTAFYRERLTAYAARGWEQAAGVLNRLYPHRAFQNAFLDRSFA